ncbi:MAG: hypothetical protein V3U18_05290 [Alphaproteobacteria bacterium]
MTAENFQIIRDICRVGLFYSGGAEQVRRHVARLRNRLNRHAKELVAQGEGAGAEAEKAKATAARLEADAAALTKMLERTLRPALADGRDPPTPETLAKLEEDVVGALAQRGRLAPHEVDAALEIRGVFAALKEGLVARAGKGDRQRARGRRKVQRQPLERMRDDVARIYGERYRPWAREMARRQVIESNLRGPDKRLLDAVVDIVVDNRAPIWVGIEVGATAEAVESALKFALSRYAALAGFAPAWRREGLTRSRRFD